MNLTLGFSPCPNDTFLFDAMVHGRIDTLGHGFSTTLDDVEALNILAMDGVLDITKLSYHAFAYVTDTYQMLRSGSALGRGVGPLLVVKGALPLKPMSEWTVALPGNYTTAHALLKFAYPGIVHKEFRTFNLIENAVLKGEVDAGVLIHENRFTYQERGLSLVADLGERWESAFQMPIPLGGIAIRRSLPEKLKQEIQMLVSKSTSYAFAHPGDSLGFVRDHAQEMDDEVMKKHIDLYVNPFTIDLGNEGIQAVEQMLGLLAQQDASVQIRRPWLVQ